MSTPDVTVVVCTYNRAEMLRAAIRSLMTLDAPGFTYEVLIVDNASTDDTSQVITALSAESPVPIRGVRELRKGVPFARNRGVAEARGEWIAFFDDDQRADRLWLSTLMAFAREKNAACVGGAVLLDVPSEELPQFMPVVRMLLGETVGRDAVERYSSAFTPGTGNIMLHRSLFEQVGTFNEDLIVRGEDTDLFMRVLTAGADCRYTPEAIIYHAVPPERLKPRYLRQLAAHAIEDTPALDWQEQGAAFVAGMCAARIAHAAAVALPLYAVARLMGDRHRSLGALARLQMTGTYLHRSAGVLRQRFRVRQRASDASVACHFAPKCVSERKRVPTLAGDSRTEDAMPGEGRCRA